MIRDRKQRTDAKDDAPRSVSRRSSSSRDEDVVVVSAFRRFCLHHNSVFFQSFFRWAPKNEGRWKREEERSLFWCSTCSLLLGFINPKLRPYLSLFLSFSFFLSFFLFPFFSPKKNTTTRKISQSVRLSKVFVASTQEDL